MTVQKNQINNSLDSFSKIPLWKLFLMISALVIVIQQLVRLKEHLTKGEDGSGQSEYVSVNMFGDKWPFTVSSGKVMCKAPEALIFKSDNGASSRTYALNGTAKARFGYPYPNEAIDIWKFDPSLPAEYQLRIPTTAINEKARELCKF